MALIWSLVGVQYGVVNGGGDVLDVRLREAAHVDASAGHRVHVVVLADEVHLTGCMALRGIAVPGGALQYITVQFIDRTQE